MRSEYKGIVLAGGQGTRLYPSSKVVSKQLMNVYDKPMIYYPLCTLMQAGIKEILIITSPECIDQFKQLLGDGQQWGVSFSYEIQDNPNGLAEAFLISEEFLGDSPGCLILGDNILYGNDLEKILRNAQNNTGATTFSYPVRDPERFGVIEYDGKRVISIEEKPTVPKSNRASIGIYFFDKKAVEYAKQLTPSKRGELEIVDVWNHYLTDGNMNVEHLNREVTWLDAGTFDSLLLASNFISTVEKVQSYKVGCPEEVSYRNGWISKDELISLSDSLLKSGYGKYLRSIVGEK